ncbi:MAG TPA: MFS transporter [Candidatus Methylomirabilis sp.]|nr:MFS transporter [Candidatus Methylomirabilis sp.]
MTPLVLLFALAFLISVDLRILAPVLPSISESLGCTAGTVGFAMTSYSLAYGTGQLFYGPLSDRLGRIAVVRAAGLGFSVCTILASLSVTPWQFIIARLLTGAFAGSVNPLTLVFIGDTVEYHRRQVVLGRFSVVTSAALAFSASIGGLVAYFVSWRLMLAGYALLALIPVGLMWRLGPEEGKRPIIAPARAARFTDFLFDRRAQLVYIAVAIEGFLLWGGATYLGSFATVRHGLDQFNVGLLIALFGVGIMTGGLLVGAARRWLSEGMLAGIGGASMGVAYLILIPRWPWPGFALSMFGLGLGYAGLHTTLQLRGTEISPTARGKAFSLFAFTLFGGIAVGTAVLAPLVDGGHYEVLFAIAGVGLFLTGLGTALAPRYLIP